MKNKKLTGGYGVLHSSDYITVVSGLPRSGTSMMMQMLQAGGMPVLTDGVRTADDDNPRGYLELEAVKKPSTTQEWLPLAMGKVVKIVHALVSGLPAGFQYRVIFMRRDVSEVVASQKLMLERSGKTGANLTDERLAEIFTAQMETVAELLKGKPACRMLEVQHRQCLQEPALVAESVNKFLDGCLDEALMAAAVDRSLYRQRI